MSDDPNEEQMIQALDPIVQRSLMSAGVARRAPDADSSLRGEAYACDPEIYTAAHIVATATAHFLLKACVEHPEWARWWYVNLPLLHREDDLMGPPYERFMNDARIEPQEVPNASS